MLSFGSDVENLDCSLLGIHLASFGKFNTADGHFTCLDDLSFVYHFGVSELDQCETP